MAAPCRLCSARVNLFRPRHCRELSRAQTEPTRGGKVKPFSDIPRRSRLLKITQAANLIFPSTTTRIVHKNMQRIFPVPRSPIYLDGGTYNFNFESLVVLRMDDAMTVLRSEGNYPTRNVFKILYDLLEEARRPTGMFFSRGEPWAKYRKAMNKKMLRPLEIGSQASRINQVLDDFVEEIRRSRNPAGTDAEYEVKGLGDLMNGWAFENVALLFFDKRFGVCGSDKPDPRALEFIPAIRQFFSSLVEAVALPAFLPRYYKTEQYKRFAKSTKTGYDTIEAFLCESIEEMEAKQEEEKQGSFLHHMIASGRLDEEDLLATIHDSMFGGVDSTTITVQWCLYELGRHPDVLRRLEDEVFSVLAPKERLDMVSTQRTPYLRAVVKETLRLYAFVPALPRLLDTDVILSGYHVPANTQVQINVRKISRDPELFPEPERFYPERWFGASPEQKQFTNLPFGFGKRTCIGRRFAELELYLLLARLVQEFRIAYPSGDTIPEAFNGFPRPSKDIPIKFYDR